MKIGRIISLTIGLVVLLCLLGAAWIWYCCFGPGYYSELNAVKAQFRKLPGVELIDANGNDDITLEHIWATINVKGKGRLTFLALTTDSFEAGAHVQLLEIGPYRFEVNGTGYVGVVKSATGEPVRSQFYCQWIDIGPSGACARFFPFSVRSIPEAIERYDDICVALSAWLVEPDVKKFKDSKGSDYSISIKINQAVLAIGANAPQHDG
jgi:hypothetical protein